jgi:membrane protease YdiL (CAAX protease family)
MQNKTIDRVVILNVTIVVEAVLLLVATFWSQLAEIPLLPLFVADQQSLITGVVAGFGIAASGFALLWLAKQFASSSKWLAELRTIVLDEVAPLFTTLTIPDIILVAVASGFCEEVFFRGVIQSQFGVFGAAAFFAIFHCPSLRHLPYGLWAFTAGLCLGGLMLFTHSLWTPILAHSISNLIVLIFMRYPLKHEAQDTPESTGEPTNKTAPAVTPAPQPIPASAEAPKPSGPIGGPASPVAAEASKDAPLNLDTALKPGGALKPEGPATNDATPTMEPGTSSQSSTETKQ